MRMIAAVLAVGLAAGCGGGAGAGSTPHGWVAGVALGGRPVCPTPTATELNCHRGPLPHAVLVVTGSGSRRRIHADAHGRFRIALAPGRYLVRAAGAPVPVRILADRVVHIQVPGAGADTGAGE